MKVAIIHYWLVGMRGGEKVLEALLDIYPQADIYTHVMDETKLSPKILSKRIFKSPISNLPLAKKFYKYYLFLMPVAMESWSFEGYDLIISCESGPSKLRRVPKKADYVCYCHTPMRYLWDMQEEYLQKFPSLMRWIPRLLLNTLKRWDVETAQNPKLIIANSNFVGKRIRTYWHRDSQTVHPPVNLQQFHHGTEGDYYLCFGELVGYKRVDLAIEACLKMNRRLVIAGGGEETQSLKRLAKGSPQIEFKGRVSDLEATHLLANCRALLFPGVEDFGITPLEAMASGRPVLAFSRGGALETVVEGVTGMFFHHQTPEDLAILIAKFEAQHIDFSPKKIQDHAKGFNLDRFCREIKLSLKI